MIAFSSRLATFLLGLTLMCGLSAPAHAQRGGISQGEVLAAQRLAESAARAAAQIASTAAAFRAQADSFAAQAAAATNPRVRAALRATANYWSAIARIWEGSARAAAVFAQQAANNYQTLLRRFLNTTCRLLPNLPLCSVSRN